MAAAATLNLPFASNNNYFSSSCSEEFDNFTSGSFNFDDQFVELTDEFLSSELLKPEPEKVSKGFVIRNVMCGLKIRFNRRKQLYVMIWVKNVR